MAFPSKQAFALAMLVMEGQKPKSKQVLAREAFREMRALYLAIAEIRNKGLAPTTALLAEQRRAQEKFWALGGHNAMGLAQDERGVVAVEFAILSVPMLMLIGICFYAGLAFYSLNALQFGTSQAAVASVAGQGGNPQAIFAANIPKTLTGAAVTCNPGTGATTCTAQGSMSVPFAGLFGASRTQTLTATATAAQPAPAQ
jgi:Flp pilus assembly protein TadG